MLNCLCEAPKEELKDLSVYRLREKKQENIFALHYLNHLHQNLVNRSDEIEEELAIDYPNEEISIREFEKFIAEKISNQVRVIQLLINELESRESCI